MERLISLLLLLLIVSVLGVGFVVARADDQARDDRRETACLGRVQATAAVALLVPSSKVDVAGRLAAVDKLGAAIEGC